MRRSVFVMALLVLASCGTPQERCIASASRDLRIFDRLTGEIAANVERGYALDQLERTREYWAICRPAKPATATEPAQPAEHCLRERSYTEVVPRAIDLAEERRKLADMRRERVALASKTAKAEAVCRMTHPE